MEFNKIIIDYYKNWPSSGLYINDLKKVYNYVSKYLLNFKKNYKNAVIFDLDDTVFFTDPANLYNIDKLSQESNYLIYPANKPIVDLVKLCNKLDIKVIFITARPYASEKSSEINIKKLGMNYFRMFHNKEYPNSEFKIGLKKNLSKQYNILLAIGDSWNDIKGLNNCLCIKLPKIDDLNVYFTYDNKKYYYL